MMIKQLTLTCAMAALAGVAHAQIVQDFQFNDAVGTGLANTANSGTLGTSWNFNVNGQPGEAATDGLGTFFIGANATAGSSAISSDYTRKVEFLGTPVSSGVVTLEFRVNSWDLSSLFSNAGVALKLRDSTDSVDVTTNFYLTSDSSSVRIRTAPNGSGTGAAQQSGFALSSGVDGIVIQTSIDLDAGSWTSQYKFDSEGSYTSIASGVVDPTLTQIDEITMTIEGTDGTDTWSSSNFVGLDYITVTAVPEPGAYAAIAGFSILAFAYFRRRK